jgi:kindlin 2
VCTYFTVFSLLIPQQNGTWKKGYSKPEMNGNVTSLEMLNGSLDTSLANSPLSLNQEVRNKVLKPKSLVEKARMNVA